ncbi:MAG: DNA polymerase I [Anaerolineaceae bacterium]|nr:DNA polymerase I [Anaerolineaceae bacterium]
MPPILYLIDGHALAYRTYYALSAAGGDRFRTSTGEPTAGVYGFASVLLRLLEQDQPEYLAVVFDTGKTFRNELYPEYKATREKMPDDLRTQFNRIYQLVDSFHLPRLEKEGFEADDVLGSVAQDAVRQGFGVKILTGDRDLLQLVNDRIIVNLPGKRLADSRDYTAKDVVEYMGVRPDQIIDFKALAGDSSDNIPGVPGVGKKTAVSLLRDYDTLDDIYAHIDALPTRAQNRLREGRDSAYLSYKLAEICTDVEITLDLEQASTKNLNLNEVDHFFQEMEFRTLRSRLKNLLPAGQTAQSDQQLSLFGETIKRVGIQPDYQPEVVLVDNQEALEALRKALDNADVIALDTETTATDPMLAELVGISLAVREGQGYYIPVGHKTDEPQLPLDTVLDALQPALTDPAKEKVGHNLKYDGIMLERYGLKIKPYGFDTMIAGFLIAPASRHLGLKDMAEDELGIRMTHIESLISSGKSQITMDKVAIKDTAAYAVADAEVTLQLQPVMQKRMQEVNATEIFRKVEMTLVPVLAQMEQVGITLDTAFFDQFSKQLVQRREELQTQVFQAVGYTFNLNSTQQLSTALFENLGLTPPTRKRTSSGHYSTSASVLEAMQNQHPVINWLLEYREVTKLQSTYVEALPKQINPHTGRVHTSFNQTGTVTGRISSNNPNLQNIPTRTELGRQVRNGFIAAHGCLLVAVDYSQIELRIVAHMSNDEAMLAAFRAGQDIHATTAAAIYNIPLDAVSKDQRRHAKAINFGLIYGMSPFGLSNSTGLTLAEAENFVKAYFEQFPNVKSYLDGIRETAAEQGYVETLLGRRRYFPNLQRQINNNLRRREEREAINAPIQGTAADIMKLAMIQLPQALIDAGLKSQIALQIHDELILECPEDELHAAVKTTQTVMENTYELSIPLLTDARWGDSWGTLKPYRTS